ncbi:MAG: hypothetical protein ABSD80_03165 [Caulobacteraceae bacterium]|jgi:hypothetical protein
MRGWNGAWLGVALALLSSGALAAEDHLWAKAGATEAAVAADLETCVKEARSVPVRSKMTTPIVVGGGVLAGAAGGAAAYLLESAILRHGPLDWAGQAVLHRCMRRRDYLWTPLTPDEAGALQQASHDGRTAVVEKFYSEDLSTRLAEVAAAAPQALPEARPAPLTFAGLSLDPAAMVVTKGVAADDDVVLRGPVGVTRTATLRNPIDVSHTAHADAGTVFYEVVGAAPWDHGETYWCGPFAGRVNGCLSNADHGYDLWWASGAGPYAGGPGIEGLSLATSAIALDPTDTPALGPYRLEVKARWFTVYAVMVEIDVLVARRRIKLLQNLVAYASDGTAVLPFWTHRLVLRRNRESGGGVQANFTPDGDGKGWLDAKPPT